MLILIPTGSLSAIGKMNYFFSAFAYRQLWLQEVIDKETRQCSMSVATSGEGSSRCEI